MHLAFRCHFSRACWLAGTLAIRSDQFDLPIKETMVVLMKLVPGELWQEVAISLWSIWRCRNDLAFQAKTPTFRAFNSYASLIRAEIVLAESQVSYSSVQSGMSATQIENHTTTCHVDGSWILGWMGGVGFVIQKEGILLAYKSTRAIVCCPLQAETLALLQGVDFVSSQGLQQCTFLTDNLILAEACMAHRPPTDVDWRAHKEIYEVWKKMKGNLEFNCCHVARTQNGLADMVAKRGTRSGESYMGFTYPIFAE